MITLNKETERLVEAIKNHGKPVTEEWIIENVHAFSFPTKVTFTLNQAVESGALVCDETKTPNEWYIPQKVTKTEADAAEVNTEDPEEESSKTKQIIGAVLSFVLLISAFIPAIGISNTTNTINNTKATITKIENENSELENSLNELNQENSELEQEIEQLKQEIADLRASKQ